MTVNAENEGHSIHDLRTIRYGNLRNRSGVGLAVDGSKLGELREVKDKVFNECGIRSNERPMAENCVDLDAQVVSHFVGSFGSGSTSSGTTGNSSISCRSSFRERSVENSLLCSFGESDRKLS